MVKLMNDILPTHNHLHHMGQRANNCCPRCDQPETLLFVISCSSRSAWRLRLIASLRQYFEATETDEWLSAVFIETVHEAIGLPHAHNTSKYRMALIAQQQIVLVGLFRGYISTEWAKIHGRFYEGVKRAYDPLTWKVGFLEILLRASIEVRLERNGDVHGDNSTQRSQRLHKRWSDEILDWHSRRHLRFPRDRDLIPHAVKEFCDSQTHTQLHAWLLQHRETLGQSIRLQERHNTSKM
jgi:hypothetical protein